MMVCLEAKQATSNVGRLSIYDEIVKIISILRIRAARLLISKNVCEKREGYKRPEELN